MVRSRNLKWGNIETTVCSNNVLTAWHSMEHLDIFYWGTLEFLIHVVCWKENNLAIMGNNGNNFHSCPGLVLLPALALYLGAILHWYSAWNIPQLNCYQGYSIDYQTLFAFIVKFRFNRFSNCLLSGLIKRLACEIK